MRDIFLDIYPAARQTPVFSFIPVCICYFRPLISDVLFNLTWLFKSHSNRLSIICLDYLVTVVFCLRKLLSTFAGNFQSSVFHSHNKISVSIFISNIISICIIKRLHDPEFTCWKAGRLYIPVTIRCIRIIVSVYICIILRISVWKFCQVYIISGNGYLYRFPVLDARPGSSLFAWSVISASVKRRSQKRISVINRY